MSEARLLAPKLSPTEKGFRLFFLAAAIVALGQMFLIALFLLNEAAGLLATAPLGDFLFSKDWYPTYEPPEFGALALIVGSVVVTIGSSLIATPVGLGLAIYLAFLAGRRKREWIKPAVELMAGVPSVVLGFIGLAVVAPFLQDVLDLPTGLNVLNASFILALMAIPSIASLGEDALAAVPRDVLDASYALGATRWETIWKVAIPAAMSGLSTAVILGLGRALGETLVVLMVAGGAAQIPTSIFDSVRPMTATLAAEMGETAIGSAHYHALFALGAVLFVLTLAFNLLAYWLGVRWRRG
ncbi:MAG: phosphate ABC transporter permease subunit PstC [Deltaproteobacteria bacterium]|jgi:phosphate transport system permease protein|nr:phosphate ABC transporter permease subunit PstC [Deltaproteobacteria bacterium]